jgi:hypothetical protein
MKQPKLIKSLACLSLLLAISTARADLSLTLLPSSRSALGTNYIVFTGLLTNRNTSGNFYLNNIAVTFNGAAGSYFSADANSFFGNVPGILQPGDSYNDVIFALALSSNTPQTNYSGTVTIRGGSDIFASTDLVAQSFQIFFSPSLTIARSGANVLLAWPASGQIFTLQQNSNLRTTNWTTVTNSPALTGSQYQVTLPVSPGAKFFRLKYP